MIGGSTSHVEAYIKAFWTHLQANFCHSSLGSKVFVERLPGIKHYVGETITRKSLGNMMPHTEADLNGADLMLFVGTGGGGVAWVGVICDNKGNSSKGIENKTIRIYGFRRLHPLFKYYVLFSF